jgi:hypothetical protein
LLCYVYIITNWAILVNRFATSKIVLQKYYFFDPSTSVVNANNNGHD